MAVAGLLRIEALLTGLAAGQRTVGPFTQTTAVGRSDSVDLATGANTITPPTGATVVLIIPPTANTSKITLKGITGDTGVSISRSQPTVLSLNAVTTFVLTAGGAVTNVELVWM